MMTKKDFVVIADILHRARKGVERHSNGLHLAQFDYSFVPAICDELAQINPRFDRKKFMRACGVPHDTRAELERIAGTIRK